MSTVQPAKRWTAARKAELIRAVNERRLTKEQVCKGYGVSSEEFDAWSQAYSYRGVDGLRATPKRRLAS